MNDETDVGHGCPPRQRRGDGVTPAVGSAWERQLRIAVQRVAWATGGDGERLAVSTTVTREGDMARWRRLFGQLVLLLAVAGGWALGPRDASGGHNFGDVPDSAFYHAFVQFLVDNGITAGCAPGAFCGEQAVTRGQMAVFLQKLSDAVDQRVATTVAANTAALQAQITALQSALVGVLGASPCLRREGNEVIFEGCNVHVRSGGGATDAPVNGLGNLIVGYNEPSTVGPADVRTGSHNLVVGQFHSFSSHGGLVAGLDNAVSGPNATVSGGQGNSASASGASVTGGFSNVANGVQASVTGGSNNTASGFQTSVTGGVLNSATGFQSSVSGGSINTANSQQNSVSGGSQNTATGSRNSVTGGFQNTAGGDLSTVSGGQLNSTLGFAASVSGGLQRSADDDLDWAAGTLLEDQ
jgi:hypothetical protein